MATMRNPRRRSRLALSLSAGALLLGLLALISGLGALTGGAPDFDKACTDGQPYFVTAAYRAQTAEGRAPNMAAASVILFQDTPRDRPHYTLATYAQTGPVWGLAYRPSEPALYAAAYHKSGLPYGPGGSGGIYRIDLATGGVAQFLTVPNAGNGNPGALPSGEPTLIEEAMREVGKTSLGGLELNAAGTELYVTNLNDRRIYRYAMPDGTLLGSFDHGAITQPWADAARPFGVAYHNGSLFHGVLNSLGTGPEFVAQVYRSMPDGSAMAEVASLNLDYSRDAIRLRTVSGSDVDWRPWIDQIEQAEVIVYPTPRGGFIPFYPTPMPKPRYEPRLHEPQPMFTDLALTADDDLVVALRDRFLDMQIQWVKAQFEVTWRAQVDPARPTLTPEPGYVFVMSEEALGFGDLLRGKPTPGGSWGIQTVPEHFDDSNDLGHAESAFGGVAWVPNSTKLASTHFGVQRSNDVATLGEEGVYWYDVPGGGKAGIESVGKPAGLLPYAQLVRSARLAWADNGEIIIPLKRTVIMLRDVASLGDVEVLCGLPPDVPPPTEPPTATGTAAPPTPTDTTVPATATASPPPASAITSTPTAPPATASSVPPTPARGPAYLPLLLREHCDPTRIRADVVLVLDASNSMAGAKIAAAKAAAIAFIRAMRLPDDQVGVVAFNQMATVINPLSGDRAALEAAIGGITVAEGTRIDTGLEAAQAVLAGPERMADHSPVVVVMTDGIQSAEPERPLALAGELRAGGVELYVVGLGTDVDVDYLTRLTGEPARLYLSPTPETLASAYERIARVIPCPAGAFWGGR